MNNDSMGTRNRVLLFVLVLLLAIPLTLLLWNVARDAIVVPLLYILWLGRLIFRAIPQVFLWLSFLVIALSHIVKSLTKQRKPAREIPDREAPSPGRVGIWTRRIHLTERRSFSRWYFAQHLHKLILDILAHHERVETRQIKQRLENGELDAPPEVQTYLSIGLARIFPKYTLLSRLRRYLPLGMRTSPLDLDLESVVQFLEERLKIEAGDQI